MPSWKKILQSGSAIHVLNITASGLPNTAQANIVGYNSQSGIFTYFSASSLVSGGSVIGGSGTQNYITRWSGNTTITTSSIYESGSRIGIGTGAVLPTATLQILGTLSNGFQNAANGDYSHAEGQYTNADGTASHAEGYSTTANGDYSHAEGQYTNANGTASHAEGAGTIANGDYSHTEGLGTIANGDYSHAEGFSTKANGDYSHAEGTYTIAEGYGQHVKGIFNTGSSLAFATIIGNGFFGPHGTPTTLRNLVEIKPTSNISDFYGPVRITRTTETAANLRNNPDALRDQDKAGIVYIGFQYLFNKSSRGASPPIAVKVNDTTTGTTNYGTLKHPPPRTGNTSYYTLIRHPDNTNQGVMLSSGQTSNPYNVINTGIFTDGAVTAQEIRSLGSSGISSTSDVRLKENIKGIDIETALRLIENVKPVSFNWKRPESSDNLDTITGKYDVGVIAQDVMKNGFDHLITIAENPLIKEHTDEEGNISKEGYEFGVSYVSMIPYHAAVIKHLLDEIKELKEEIKKLK
jgi:hypothetical protein